MPASATHHKDTSMQMIHCVRSVPRVMVLASLVLASGMAMAAEYPVTGMMSVNGNPGALPSGGRFISPGYDPVSGLIAAGAFSFPQASNDVEVPGYGMVKVTYQLSQTNTSGGVVMGDGVAVLGSATMKLQVVSMLVGGFIPIPLGTCVFQPITFALGGMADAGGLELDDEGFTIPPVAASDCAGLGAEINDAIAGNNNRVELFVAGDFSPPSGAGDTIFVAGFDPSRGSE